jgi:GNAT superfamily N-acetyltransferase
MTLPRTTPQWSVPPALAAAFASLGSKSATVGTCSGHVAQNEAMPRLPLVLTRATDDGGDMAMIIRLIEEAAVWLRTKNTDQWATPWPDRAGRDDRVRAALRQGTSWICWDNGTPAATITADPDEDPYWSDLDFAESAVYVHRLVISRQYAGTGLGAALLDWAGQTARRDHGARWLRVSAWTTNLHLHAYYLGQGYSFCGFHKDHEYPSTARFQKATADIPATESGLFRQT